MMRKSAVGAHHIPMHGDVVAAFVQPAHHFGHVRVILAVAHFERPHICNFSFSSPLLIFGVALQIAIHEPHGTGRQLILSHEVQKPIIDAVSPTVGSAAIRENTSFMAVENYNEGSSYPRGLKNRAWNMWRQEFLYHAVLKPFQEFPAQFDRVEKRRFVGQNVLEGAEAKVLSVQKQ